MTFCRQITRALGEVEEDGGGVGILSMISQLAFEDTDKPLLSMKKTLYIYIYSPLPPLHIYIYIYMGEREKGMLLLASGKE